MIFSISEFCHGVLVVALPLVIKLWLQNNFDFVTSLTLPLDMTIMLKPVSRLPWFVVV